MSSLNDMPLLYINLGGEMLYVLRQRLKAQKIAVDKTVQVLNDVTVSLLDPEVIISLLESKSSLIDMTELRTKLESVALSSIMRLDSTSLDKLFDLMIMLVKYQLTASTGPREVISIVLNHLDGIYEMVTSSIAQNLVALIHRKIVDFYGNLTHNEVWELRNDCLKELQSYNVRISILLKLGLQNENGTFNSIPENFDEKYEENKDVLRDFKIIDVTCTSLTDCGTILGKNIYLPSYGKSTRIDCGSKDELGMLALQLGTERISSDEKPFNLHLFEKEDTTKNDEYKNKIHRVIKDFDEIDQDTNGVSLLDLLDRTN